MVLFLPLVPSFQCSPPLIFFPKKTTVRVIKSKYFFFCSLLDQLMIVRKELPLALNKKENYVNKNFSSAMSSRLMKLSGPIYGAIKTFQPSQNSLHMFPFVPEQYLNLLACWPVVSSGRHAWLFKGLHATESLPGSN